MSTIADLIKQGDALAASGQWQQAIKHIGGHPLACAGSKCKVLLRKIPSHVPAERTLQWHLCLVLSFFENELRPTRGKVGTSLAEPCAVWSDTRRGALLCVLRCRGRLE